MSQKSNASRKCLLSVISPMAMVASMLWLLMPGAHAGMVDNPDPIVLGLPMRHAIKDDPLLSLKASAPSGKLVYVVNINMEGKSIQRFLVLRQVAKETEEKEETSVTTYPVTGIVQRYARIFDPQFSPDGRYILFKVGDPYHSHGTYRLYVWELDNNQVRAVSKQRLTYRNTLWSPDSNFIAYVQGGDMEGNPEHDEVLRLYTCDWRTGKERLVMENNGVQSSFAWGPPHVLYYSTLPVVKDVTAQGKSQRPDIHAQSAKEGKARLVVRDGYRPRPSPDGQWIAFYGSENPSDPKSLGKFWKTIPYGSSLLVIKSDGSGRKALNSEQVSYSNIRWLPDSKHLLTLKQEQPSPKATAKIKEWDIVTGKFKQVIELQAKDYERIDRIKVEPQFRLLDASQDGFFLFLAVSEITGIKKEENLLIQVISLQSIDLRDDTLSVVSEVETSLGVDWHSDSGGAVNLRESKDEKALS